MCVALTEPIDEAFVETSQSVSDLAAEHEGFMTGDFEGLQRKTCPVLGDDGLISVIH